MARGLFNALQAALAGVAGGAQGYAQYQEMERKRLQEQKDRERQQAMDERERSRQEMMDTLAIRNIGGFEAGPVATRAPGGAPAPQAAAGAPVTGAIPSAIPMAGVSAEDLQAAEAGRERYETGGPGAMQFSIGGRTLTLPGLGTLQRERSGDELSAAVQQAQAMANVKRGEEATSNRSNYETYKEIYGKRGTYNPNLNYAQMIEAAESERTRANARTIAGMRTAPSPSTGGGTTARDGERGTLTSVLSTIDRLGKMTDEDVLSLRPGFIAAATEAPLMTAQASGLWKFPALGVASGLNWAADSEEREYANMIASVGDAVARAAEGGRLTDQDVARYRAQVTPLGGDDERDQLRKFETLKSWAQWLASDNPATRLPGETIDEFDRRTSMLRRR